MFVLPEPLGPTTTVILPEVNGHIPKGPVSLDVETPNVHARTSSHRVALIAALRRRRGR